MPAWRVKSTLLSEEGKGQGELRAAEQAARGMYESEIARARQGDVINIHDCPHALGTEDPATWFDCRHDPRSAFEETIKTTGPPA